MTTHLKDPSAVLDYLFNWGDWLNAGEAIVSKTVTVQTGITKNSDTIVNGTDSEGVAVTSGAVLVWLSGGTAGVDYTVACLITTNAPTPRTDERTMTIRVRNR